MRNFDEWFSKFKESISSYDYYTDFQKVIENVDKIKIELNILNSLIGSKDIKRDFLNIVKNYPETLKCIPILLAVRNMELYAQDDNEGFNYNFLVTNQSIEQYIVFMEKTGLFNMLENHIVNNLVDYVLGVETGLDSNARKNRGGHLMENLVEKYIVKAGFIKDKTYFKEITSKEVEIRWNIDLSTLSNNGKTIKRFDFIIYNNGTVYGIETNFYASNGSKLNETARSYKMLSYESENIENFEFVWFTDGKGWRGAKENLRETFEAMKHIYSINDMEEDIIKKFVYKS